MSSKARSLFLMYQKAGPTVLAHRLQRIFDPVKDSTAAALHNDALGELRMIIDGQEGRFVMDLARLVLEIGQKKYAAENT